MINPFLIPIGDDSPLDWRDDAACVGTDPDAFFVGKGGDPKPALKICRGCPVTAECLDWALRHGETGVWGATTDRQRRDLRRARGITVVSHWEHGDPGGAARHRREGTQPCAACLRTENQQNYENRRRRQERTA